MKKTIFLAVVFLFIVSGIVCARGGGESARSLESTGSSSSSPYSMTNQKVTFTYWVALPAAAPVQTMNEMAVYQEMERLTNVYIDFLHPPAGQETEQFNLMIASRDLPDIIEYSWGSYPGGVDKAIDDNVIVNLTSKIQTLAADYYARITSSSETERQVKTDRGNFYAFQAIGLGGVNAVTNGLTIREDWRRELGIALPETIDEITAMLTRFKNEKGAEAPFTGVSTIANEAHIAGAFGVGTGYYMTNNGTAVKYGPIEPAFRDYLALMRDWFAQGLLDPDFAANDGKARDAKITTNQSGLFTASLGGGIGLYLNAMKGKGTFDLAGIKSPVLRKGDVSNFGSLTRDMRPSGMAAVMSVNRNQDLAIKWLNFWYSDEGNLLRNFGVEGLTYNLTDGYPKYTDLILDNPDGLSIGNALLKYCRAAQPSPGLIDQRYADQYTFEYAQQRQAVELWRNNLEQMKLTMMVPVTFTPDESTRIAATSSNINTYAAEMIPKFIMGTEDLARYDEFISQLKRLGVEQELQIRQQALNRYNARVK